MMFYADCYKNKSVEHKAVNNQNASGLWLTANTPSLRAPLFLRHILIPLLHWASFFTALLVVEVRPNYVPLPAYFFLAMFLVLNYFHPLIFKYFFFIPQARIYCSEIKAVITLKADWDVLSSLTLSSTRLLFVFATPHIRIFYASWVKPPH